MKKIILILIVLFVAMEALGWWMYKKKNSSESSDTLAQVEKNNEKQPAAKVTGSGQDSNINYSDPEGVKVDIPAWNGSLDGFPPPTVEEVDGVMQRVIHVGVRKWQWDPGQLEAKVGEKVILIMHNADVTHSFSAPELGVKEEIPEEGAVVMFEAKKAGTFEFSCSTPCGEGHSRMKGKIIIS